MQRQETAAELGKRYLNGSGVAQSDAEAAKWFDKAAVQGDPVGQYHLGWMYQKGRGVKQNDAEAVRWFRKAAEQGHIHGQGYLGWMYVEGRGVPQDYVEASKWVRRAAEQGNAPSQHTLGALYRDGLGVTADISEAMIWFRKAADQGDELGRKALAQQEDAEMLTRYRQAAKQSDRQAQYSLGWMYHQGRGVPRDDMKAHWWLVQAADWGHAEARRILAEIPLSSISHTGETKEWSPAQSEDDREMAKLYIDWAQKGHVLSQYYAGWVYSKGRGVGRNADEAARWLELAVKAGHAEAKTLLAKVEPDVTKEVVRPLPYLGGQLPDVKAVSPTTKVEEDTEQPVPLYHGGKDRQSLRDVRKTAPDKTK